MDPKADEMLYREHFGRAVSLAFLATGDRDAAEDIAQDALLRCLRSVQRVRSPESFGAYVAKAVSREAMNRHRSESRRKGRETAYGGHVQTDQDNDPATGAHGSIVESLARLSTEQRLTVALRYWDDLPFAQIATAMGCSVGTVKSRLCRALTTLKGDMDETVLTD